MSALRVSVITPLATFCETCLNAVLSAPLFQLYSLPTLPPLDEPPLLDELLDDDELDELLELLEDDELLLDDVLLEDPDDDDELPLVGAVGGVQPAPLTEL